MKIFFDLDGTLLDSRERLYRLFQHLVPVSELSFDGYWDMKRNKIAHAQILTGRFDYRQEQVTAFQDEWLQLIELPEWLAYDRPFEGVTAFLHQMKRKHSLFLVTARQFRDSLMDQLHENQWENIFEEVFVTEGRRAKADLIRERIETSSGDWLVGDTGKDVETGKLLGLGTAAVLSGFLSRAALEPYRPDIIVEHVPDLPF